MLSYACLCVLWCVKSAALLASLRRFSLITLRCCTLCTLNQLQVTANCFRSLPAWTLALTIDAIRCPKCHTRKFERTINVYQPRELTYFLNQWPIWALDMQCRVHSIGIAMKVCLLFEQMFIKRCSIMAADRGLAPWVVIITPWQLSGFGTAHSVP